MRTGLTLVAILAALALGLGFTGQAWPPGDALAVGRPHAAIALTLAGLVLLLLRASRRGAAATLSGLVIAGSVGAGYVASPGPEPGGDAVRLYQKNLLYRAWPRRPLAAEIVASGAEIVTLQEVSDHNRRFMAALFDAYPTQVSCPYADVGEVVVLSRWPSVPGSAACGDRDGLALVQLVTPRGETVWAASLHLNWPWPFEQAAQVERVVARLEALDGPVILAGDFNMVPWGGSVRRIAAAARSWRVGPTLTTFPRFAPLAPLAIDHVLLPAGTRAHVETRPPQGSDHLGLFVRFTLPEKPDGAP